MVGCSVMYIGFSFRWSMSSIIFRVNRNHKYTTATRARLMATCATFAHVSTHGLINSQCVRTDRAARPKHPRQSLRTLAKQTHIMWGPPATSDGRAAPLWAILAHSIPQMNGPRNAYTHQKRHKHIIPQFMSYGSTHTHRTLSL